MDNTTLCLLHNPRCSKSRQALALLEQSGASFSVRRYLDKPLDRAELVALIGKLTSRAATLVRDADAASAGLAEKPAELGTEAVIDWLLAHPSTLQRPVLIGPQAAIIGRPPEAILPLVEAAET